MSARRALFVPAALALGAALALTACGPDGGDAARPAKPAGTTTAGTAPGAAAPTAPAAPAAQPAAGAPAPAAPATAAPAGGGSARPRTPVVPATGGGAAAVGDEAYAYTHPCKADKLTVKVSARAGSPDQRVIEVHNQGTAYCGLSYYPLIGLGSSKAPSTATTSLRWFRAGWAARRPTRWLPAGAPTRWWTSTPAAAGWPTWTS